MLWVSRHEPLRAELERLRQYIGEYVLIGRTGFVPSAEWLIEEAERVGASYIWPVLPLTIIARLVELAQKRGIKVLWSRMEQICRCDCETANEIASENPDEIAVAKYRDGTCAAWRFIDVEEVVGIQIVTKPLRRENERG